MYFQSFHKYILAVNCLIRDSLSIFQVLSIIVEAVSVTRIVTRCRVISRASKKCPSNKIGSVIIIFCFVQSQTQLRCGACVMYPHKRTVAPANADSKWSKE